MTKPCATPIIVQPELTLLSFSRHRKRFMSPLSIFVPDLLLTFKFFVFESAQIAFNHCLRKPIAQLELDGY